MEALIDYLKNIQIDTKYIDDKLEIFWEKISNSDEQCDIKIKDFLTKNFCKEQLFIDIEHPHFMLLKEYAKQICSILGFNCNIFSDRNCSVYGHSIVVYPQVKKYLNLRWSDDNCKQYKTKEALAGTAIDFDEYVRQYCKIYEYWKEFNNQELKLN